MKRRDLLRAFCAVASGAFAPRVARSQREAESSELRLRTDYRLGELRDMPGPAPAHSRLERIDYPESEAVEWRWRLRAPASGARPLFENLRSADFVLRFPADTELDLHWSKGSHAEPSDFQPRTERLTFGRPFTLESYGGRSSDGAMPYFNIAGANGGLILAVGWTGDWKATFTSLGRGALRITTGLKRSRFRLDPGEEVRLPSILVMAYGGDWIDGQNRFRRLMLRKFSPPGDPMQLMPVAASPHAVIAFNDTSEARLTAFVADVAAAKLPIDTFWLDAGWNAGGFPAAQGNPDPDPVRFPRGLAPVGAAARRAGMRFLAWFEPERVMRGTWIDRAHPEWLLRPSGTTPELRYQENDGFRLLDLGLPDARNFALETISRPIREAGVSIYRQDCNLYPASFWQTGESSESIGLNEVRYTSGLYQFLDELARRHPGLIIDNCASGGRRLDFEMMRRCVALWRSDNCWDDRKTYPRNVQAMTHGLSLWLPLHGLGAASARETDLRSGMGGCASFAIDFRDPRAVRALGGHLERYLAVRPLFAADYYPLTAWSLDPAQPLAFQFHERASGKGIVQAFCRPGVGPRSARLRLRGLDAGRRYVLKAWDASEESLAFSGAELMRNGPPASVLRGSEAPVLQYAPAP